jgi:beta-mannosidase
VRTVVSLNGSDWLCKPYVGLDWMWRDAEKPGSRDRLGWLPATVPGSVQHDLWQAGEIPNPYAGRNTLLAEWASQRTWLYKKAFHLPPELRGRRIRLHFEGVDYEAAFYLNGEKLGTHASMFTPVSFEAGSRLRFGEENLLAVVLEPAPAEQPQVGRTSLVRTHKTRMNYWWDFCPRLVHLGIWDGVSLESSGAVSIEDVWVRPLVGDGQPGVPVPVRVEIELSACSPARAGVEVTIRDPEGRVVAEDRQEQELANGAGRVSVALEIDRPCLWWPNGSGEQPLYSAAVRVFDLEAPVVASDERQLAFGLRRLEWAPNEGTRPGEARPYTLLVNGRRVYIKGWNWVPLDLLYGPERPAKLERLLRLARSAHVNFLRVWGGGLVEKQSFYELCDRLGILVWQEFVQSSSGIENTPPDDPAVVAMLAAEARQIVARKRNHPSLAIWCGGNELTTAEGRPLDEGHAALAALASAVKQHDPDRLWLPTSPSGPEFSNCLEVLDRNPGGMHDVHGPWEHQGLEGHYALYNRGASLLHSEFGVEGITNRRTLDATIPTGEQWPVSLENPAWFHLGAWWLKEATLRAAFGDLPDVDSTVRAAQFLQADGLRYAVEADRRRKYHNSGSLPWQFNEPYPMAACTSAVDYYARPKPAYYAVRAAYEPLHVSARFERQAWAGHVTFEAEIWANSSLEQELPATLELAFTGLRGRQYATRCQPVVCPANAAVRLTAVSHPLGDEGETKGMEDEVFFLDLCLTAANGQAQSRNRYLFVRGASLAPLLWAPETELEATVALVPPSHSLRQPALPNPPSAPDGNEAAPATEEQRHRVVERWQVTLRNKGGTAALMVWLEEAHDLAAPGYAYLDDNHVCLLPGEARTLTVTWDGVPEVDRKLLAGGWNTQVLELCSPI